MKTSITAAMLLCAPLSLLGLSIEQAVQTTLDANPKMQQRISDYRATQYDLEKAKAGYLPTVDLSASVGPEHTERKATNTESDLTRKEANLVVTENLFDGFNTQYSIEEQEARVQTSRYYVMQEADNLALTTVETYLTVIKNKLLLDIERENVGTHERIYKMTREKNEAGIGRRSDLEQTESRMSLAYSNYIAQQNNYQDSMINFERLYGRLIPATSMQLPSAPALPEDHLSALQTLALKYNPTLLIEHSNVETQQAKHAKEQSNFYPKLDAELSADYKNNIDGVENNDRAYRAMLRFYYNLYNGGSDEATRLQNLEVITSQQFSLNEQERAVIEQLKLAWMSFQYYTDRIRCLELHEKLSKKTAESYAEEYHLGRRSLLDLLNVELEYSDARKELINARHELLYSHYRVLESLGLITYRLDSAVYQKIALKEPEGIAFDTTEHVNYTEFGESDDYLNLNELCRKAFEPIVQTLFDPDVDTPDIVETPLIVIEETASGTVIDIIKGVNFAFASAELSPESKEAITPVIEKLKADQELTIEIHGHTDIIGQVHTNQMLSEARAESAKSMMTENGIAPERITTFGHSYNQPIADNTTSEGRMMNRRIEFIIKEGKAISE
jgi:adhesin transport system outer membrane protein